MDARKGHDTKHTARRTVAVRAADSTWLDRFARRAAEPAVYVRDRADAFEVDLRAPGATAHNTDVAWDPERGRCVVSVWNGRPPAERALRSFPLPEPRWWRVFASSESDFSRARARVRRGTITLDVPKRAPPKPVWEP